MMATALEKISNIDRYLLYNINGLSTEMFIYVVKLHFGVN